MDIEKVLVCNKIFFGENNYKYLTGYLYSDNKVKPLHIMLPKTRAYVKRLWWTNQIDVFFDWSWWIINNDSTVCSKVNADIKSNFIANLSTIKNFWKPK